jgi:hypothetical protein
MSDPADFIETQPFPRLGALVRRLAIRVVNISAVGCLLESPQPVDVGTVAVLGLRIGERRYVDPIRISRLVRLSGGIWAFRLGAEFLTLTPPSAATLRRMALLEGADLVVPAGTRTTSDPCETQERDTQKTTASKVAADQG